jgi:hypothetical protein
MKIQLIDDCRHWWRMASVQLALLAGLGAGIITADPDLVKQAIALVPEPWRPLASLLAGVVVAGIPILARMTKQPKLDAARDGQ